jgi:signal transduction histidine kinase/ligand-binding sensor domain-containing protein
MIVSSEDADQDVVHGTNDTASRAPALTQIEVCLRRCLAAALVAAASALPAAAQLPQAVHHTRWLAGRELPTAGVSQIERTPDGYLWLGSSAGLIRFDGVRFVVLDSATTPALVSAGPGGSVPLAVDRSGTLWIRRPDRTLVHYRAGEFRIALPSDSALPRIDEIVQDGSGRVWLRGDGRVFVWRDGGLTTPELHGAPAVDITGIISDNDNGIWLSTRGHGVWHVTPNSATRFVHPDASDNPGARATLYDSSGRLWLSGLRFQVLVNGTWQQPQGMEGQNLTYYAVSDVDGSLWFATRTNGLVQWRDGIARTFTARDGLSNSVVHDMLRDYEGNLWITTDAGLDRLRTTAFTTISGADVPFETPLHLASDAGGGVWAMDYNTLGTFLLEHGRIAGRTEPMRTTPLGGRDVILTSSRNGGVWMFELHSERIYLVRNGASTVVGSSPELTWLGPRVGYEDPSGTLWVAASAGGFGRVRDFVHRAIALPGQGRWPRIGSLTGDAHGRTWVAIAGEPILFEIEGDSVRRRFNAVNGTPPDLRNLTLESGDTLWATSAEQLVRLIGGRANTIDIPELRPALMSGSVVLLVTRAHLWLGSQHGIARLPLTALHAAADRGAALPAPEWFGALDGLVVGRTTRNNVRAGFEGGDGRIWFATPAGLAVADPDRIPTNSAAPTPLVEEIRVTDEGETIAAGDVVIANPDRVDIHFTTASLRTPERVRIEYRLDGADHTWVPASLPRRATYTQLRPGRYRFRVRAWNEDGVAARGEASLSFRVLPAWHQTSWFRTLLALAIAGAGAGLLLLVQRTRQRQIQERIQAGFEATLAERTRLANELHDTLLQGFTGITLQLQAVQQAAASEAPAVAAKLEPVLAMADSTLREARHTVWDMHAPELEHYDLVDALELTARKSVGSDDIGLRFSARGTRRRLSPALETAAYRIGREAVVNAVKHGAPDIIDVDIDYAAHQLRLTVRDDGRGFATTTLAAAAGSGRLGVLGMRERAARAGGTLEISATPDGGTVVTVMLPVDAPLR